MEGYAINEADATSRPSPRGKRGMGGQIWKTSTNLHLSARLFELLLRSLSLILRYPLLDSLR